MVGTEFQDQAKGFADALLASRTATILDQMSQKGTRLTPGDRAILGTAKDLLDSCLAGRKAADGQAKGEMGFLEWMENLRHYENAFEAIVRSELAEKEADITRTLSSARSKLERLLSGQAERGLNDVIELFNSISEVNLDVAQDSTVLAPQEFSVPEEAEFVKKRRARKRSSAKGQR
jgi:hypothetical protein